MVASKPERKSSAASTTLTKPLSKAPRKSQAKSAARKAVVLGQSKMANGKVYQVLAPAAGPRHLSSEDVQQAVKPMVSAR